MVRVFVILVLIITASNFLAAQPAEFAGQASSWLQFGRDIKNNASLGLRYIPEFKWQHEIFENNIFDLEISANLFGSHLLRTSSHPDHYSAVKLYRAWMRVFGEQYELRAGLQKINFGPARILRTLRWFDRVDPRDPLQLSDGVYGLLGRYYFLNNANIWLWGLYGNNNVKGLEMLPSAKRSAEWGGRLQFPLPRGEMGITFHRRRFTDSSNEGKSYSAPEIRVAIDGSWDLGIGIWYEAALTKSEYSDESEFENKWQKLITVGSDFTFEWLNGLHVTYEHLFFDLSKQADKWQNRFDFSALMIDFMVNLTDRASLVQFYSWEQNQLYNYLSWQRSYDNWMVNLSAFWNPVSVELFNNQQTVLAGKGVQIMLVYNH